MNNWPAFLAFARELVDSRDIDPVYPVLKAVIQMRDLDGEAAALLVARYLALYNLPSALSATRDPERMLRAELPTGSERRGFRSEARMRRHWRSYEDAVAFTGHLGFIRASWLAGDPFMDFYQRAQTIWHNSRWAAFKWLDLAVHVLDVPFVFPSMMLDRSARGPWPGLRALTGLPLVPTRQELLAAAWRVRDDLALEGLNLGWDEVETVLCNWNSHLAGRYPVGHDIDEMWHLIESAPGLHPDDRADLLVARAAVIPAAYLREVTVLT